MTLIDENFLGIFLAFVAACSWGFAAILYRIVLKEKKNSILFSITIRGIFAVPFIALATLFFSNFQSSEFLFSPGIFPILVISAICVGLGDLGFFIALQRLEVSIAQPIASIYPLFTSILTIGLGYEVLTSEIFLGTAILILGVGLISQQTRKIEDVTLSNPRSITIGIISAILGAIAWSFGILTLTILLDYPAVDSLSLATVRFTILTIIVGIIWICSLIYQKYILKIKIINIRDQIQPQKVFILGIGGIISWGIGGVSFFTAIELIDSGRATPISSINPLIAVLLGVILLKEKLNKTQIEGIILVTLGSILIGVS